MELTSVGFLTPRRDVGEGERVLHRATWSILHTLLPGAGLCRRFLPTDSFPQSEVLGVFSEVQKVVSVSCVLGKHAHSFQREAFGEVLLQGTVRPGGKFVSAFPAVL